MSGNSEVDQCPFCNAKWGNCLHIKLLVGLEGEASARMTPEPPACTEIGNDSAIPAGKPASGGGAIRKIDSNKPVLCSW